jgi:hypothetical protein
LEEGWEQQRNSSNTNSKSDRSEEATSPLKPNSGKHGSGANKSRGGPCVEGLRWLEGIPMGGLSDVAAEIPTLLKGGPTSVHVASHVDILMHPEGKTRKNHEEAEEC